MVDGSFIGMIYEFIILIPATIVIFVSFRNYLKNRRYLSLLLFLLLLNYGLSIGFSWWSKIMSVFFYTDYIEIREIPSPGTFSSWILLRISYFRFTFFFITLGILFSYKFRLKLFPYPSKKYYRLFLSFFCGFNLFYSLIIFLKEVLFLDLLLFLFTFMLQYLVYIPFFSYALKSYRAAPSPSFKRNYLFLMIMSISFILVMFCLLLDRFLIFLGSPGYTIFYFITWIFVLIGILGAYLGYFKLQE
jgi:hypothetical protein